MATDGVASDLSAQLEAEREELRRRLAELGFGEDGRLDYDDNFADSSQVTAERGEAEALARSLRETLAEVEQALEKVSAGGYGVCDGCGKEIGRARMQAMPAAHLCIECAGKR